MADMKTATLGEMLGPELIEWVYKEYVKDRLTNERLRAKLEESRVFLADRGVDAGYAYYAVIYVLSNAKKMEERN